MEVVRRMSILESSAYFFRDRAVSKTEGLKGIMEGKGRTKGDLVVLPSQKFFYEIIDGLF